ncbi:MAG: YidC/Oxa1 family insertase periplasmic-domain containing protein [Opitutia bacterium]
MDRKNVFLGLACFGGALALYIFGTPRQAPAPAPAAPVFVAPANPPALTGSGALPGPAPAAAGTLDRAKAVREVLANEHIRVTFTTRGGAIEQVELLKEFADTERKEKVVFNRGNPDAALTLVIENRATRAWEQVLGEFKVAAKTKDTLTLVGTLPDGGKVERAYALGATAEPYAIRFTTRLFSPGAGVAAPAFAQTLGSWRPTEGDKVNQFLSVLTHDGEETLRTGVDPFHDSSGFFGLGASRAVPTVELASAGKPYLWVASGNQFFASIIHPATPEARGARSAVSIRPVALPEGAQGLDGMASWNTAVKPDLSTELTGEFFVGPKEYARVSALPDNQVYVLQFSKLLGFIPFAAICKLLLACLGGVHALLEWSGAWSWGWAIVALTLLIKVVTWPLTAAQQRQAKKMAKFAKPLQEINEKYKDNPEKKQKELMKLYKDHGINPLAGCLPILIQMPIFFGMYTAFQTTVELRLHSFLWVQDLAAPDTLFVLGGLPFNLLPILMGVTMWLSMKMTPSPSADSSQKTIILVMTLMFPLICYAMPAALTLYMTVQNLLTILQAAVTKEEPAVEVIPPKKAKG